MPAFQHGVAHDLRVVAKVVGMLRLGEDSPSCEPDAESQAYNNVIVQATYECPPVWAEAIDKLAEDVLYGILVAGLDHARELYDAAPEEYAKVQDFPLVDQSIFMWRGRLLVPTSSLTVYLGDEGEPVSDVWFAWSDGRRVCARRLKSVPL